MRDTRVSAAGLRREFRKSVHTEPQQALNKVEDLVLAVHEEALHAVAPAIAAGQSFRDIGRALCLLDDAGILIRQAAAELLGLPAADRAAEEEMVRQALGEAPDPEVEGDVGEHLSVTPEELAWAAAVDRFRHACGGLIR